MLRYFSFILSLFVIASCSKGVEPESYDPEGSTDTRTKEISYQVKRTWRMDNGSLSVSNDFVSSRLNDFVRQNDTLYTAVISPENGPINKSPWYAFSIWSEKERKITVELKYTDDYTHRYYPDLSHDMVNWTPIDSSDFVNDTTNQVTRMHLEIGPDTLFVAAQEIMTSQYVYNYLDSLSKIAGAQTKDIGYSTLGKPIRLLSAGNPASENVVVIIGRQHPPEATGFLALQAFVNDLMKNDSLAVSFRDEFQLIMVPMVNPDGVDMGHWRHNAGGIDLNRDWYSFNQPETSAIRDYLVSWVQENNKQILFAIDFHSTQEDLFYVFEEDRETNMTGFTHRWLDRIEQDLGDYEANRIPTSGNSPVSTRWFYDTFETEAVTYEVGDDSPRKRIERIGESAADALMELMLSK